MKTKDEPLNVNLFVTCVSKEPPALPLNQEVNSLGVEAILLPSGSDSINVTNRGIEDQEVLKKSTAARSLNMKSQRFSSQRSHPRSIKTLAAMVESSKPKTAPRKAERNGPLDSVSAIIINTKSTEGLRDNEPANPKSTEIHHDNEPTNPKPRALSLGRGIFRSRNKKRKSTTSLSFGERFTRSLSPRRRSGNREQAAGSSIFHGKRCGADDQSNNTYNAPAHRKRDPNRVYESLVSRPFVSSKEADCSDLEATPSTATEMPSTLSKDDEANEYPSNEKENPEDGQIESKDHRGIRVQQRGRRQHEKEIPEDNQTESEDHRGFRVLQRAWRLRVLDLRARKQSETRPDSFTGTDSKVVCEITPIQEEAKEDLESDASSAESSVPPFSTSESPEQVTPPRLHELIASEEDKREVSASKYNNEGNSRASDEMGEAQKSICLEEKHLTNSEPAVECTKDEQRELTVVPMSPKPRELEIMGDAASHTATTNTRLSRVLVVVVIFALFVMTAFLPRKVTTQRSLLLLAQEPDQNVPFVTQHAGSQTCEASEEMGRIPKKRPIYRQQTRRAGDRPKLHHTKK